MKSMLNRSLAGMMLLLPVFAIMCGCMRVNVLQAQLPQPGITQPVAEPRPSAQLAIPTEKDPTRHYRVGPKDVLRVDERSDPEISNTYTVTAEGNILLPYIGPVKVADLTVDEIRENLKKVLGDYGIRTPNPQVGVQTYLSKVVYVVGQVATPGPIIMNADMLTVQQAVVAAGFPTPDAALKKTKVITPHPVNPVVREVNLDDILYRGKMEHNMMLSPGDYVYIPAKYNVNLGGAIDELIRPFQGISDLYYRMSFYNNGGYGGYNNNND
ncbi:polysaccharide biosynthesis/export family protein [bacterium]|nr:polysaccharide biosynthesis/export family protein [bacterium]